MGEYQVIDKTGGKAAEIIRKEYGPSAVLLTRLIGSEGRPPEACDGDAFVIRDLLLENGLKWGRDFYIRKATLEPLRKRKKAEG